MLHNELERSKGFLEWYVICVRKCYLNYRELKKSYYYICGDGIKLGLYVSMEESGGYRFAYSLSL